MVITSFKNNSFFKALTFGLLLICMGISINPEPCRYSAEMVIKIQPASADNYVPEVLSDSTENSDQIGNTAQLFRSEIDNLLDVDMICGLSQDAEFPYINSRKEEAYLFHRQFLI